MLQTWSELDSNTFLSVFFVVETNFSWEDRCECFRKLTFFDDDKPCLTLIINLQKPTIVTYFNVRNFRDQKISRISKIYFFRGNQFSRKWIFPDKNTGKINENEMKYQGNLKTVFLGINFRESRKTIFFRDHLISRI